MEQSQEKQLIQAVKRCQQILKVYSEKITDSLQVILLIGVTGAGKSTIYNFLSGANMEIEENDDFEVQICISEQNEHFSAISDGSCSVTREPIYYYNQQLNHLLIDFPGFQDTRGKMEQLIIQMVFFKIVTSSPVKIVYVIRHPEKSLPDRGVGLQSFINEQFNDQNLDQSKLTLLLNCYADKLPIEKLKKKIQAELLKIQGVANENIVVIKKVDDSESLNEMFSIEKRKELWEKLIDSSTIQFQPKLLPNSEIVNEYLREKSYEIIYLYCLKIYQLLSEQISLLEENSTNTLLELVQNLTTILTQDSPDNMIAWFTNFINQCQSISTVLQCQDQIVIQSQEFLEIFTFFSQFSDFISGYNDCQKAGDLATNLCKQMQTLINLKQQVLKERQQLQNQLKKNQQTLEQNIEQGQELEKNFQTVCQRLKNNEEELKIFTQQHKQQSIQKEKELEQLRSIVSKLKSELTKKDLQKDQINLYPDYLEKLQNPMYQTGINHRTYSQISQIQCQDGLTHQQKILAKQQKIQEMEKQLPQNQKQLQQELEERIRKKQVDIKRMQDENVQYQRQFELIQQQKVKEKQYQISQMEKEVPNKQKQLQELQQQRVADRQQKISEMQFQCFQQQQLLEQELQERIWKQQEKINIIKDEQRMNQHTIWRVQNFGFSNLDWEEKQLEKLYICNNNEMKKLLSKNEQQLSLANSQMEQLKEQNQSEMQVFYINQNTQFQRAKSDLEKLIQQNQNEAQNLRSFHYNQLVEASIEMEMLQQKNTNEMQNFLSNHYTQLDSAKKEIEKLIYEYNQEIQSQVSQSNIKIVPINNNCNTNQINNSYNYQNNNSYNYQNNNSNNFQNKNSYNYQNNNSQNNQQNNPVTDRNDLFRKQPIQSTFNHPNNNTQNNQLNKPIILQRATQNQKNNSQKNQNNNSQKNQNNNFQKNQNNRNLQQKRA